jgi:5'-methylthioadenosine phosphorylase
MARKVIAAAIARMPERACGCGHALRDAIITDRAAIPAKARERLSLLLGRYLS